MRIAPHGLVLALALIGVLGGCRGDNTPKEDAEHKHGAEAGEGSTEHADHEGEHEEGLIVLDPSVVQRAGIRTAVVEERGLGGELTTTGQVDFDQGRVAHVSPRIDGRVHQVRADLGQAVSRGSVLLVLDSIELAAAKSEYLQAKARERVTQQSSEREEALHAERISSLKDVEEARAAHQEAAATRRAAEERLTLLGLSRSEIDTIRQEDPRASLFSIRSPLKGKVVEKHATVGEVVSPDKNLMTVADLSRVWIWIDVHERDLGKVHLGDQARVLLTSRSSAVITGTVSYLGDQVNTDSRTVRARIDVPNAGEILRPGEFAQIWLQDPHVTPTPGSEGPVVPESAIQRDGERSILFVQTSPGRFQTRQVLIGRQLGEWVEVLRGVAVGEVVAIDGTFILKSELSKEQMGEGHSH